MSETRVLPPALLAGALLVSGCGFVVPRPHEPYEATSNDTDFVNVVFNNVKCQLQRGVNKIVGSPGAENPRLAWLKTWGAKVDLKFTTDEMTSLDPGAVFKPPPPFSLGVGLNSSAHATRVEDVATTYGLDDLRLEGNPPECPNVNGIMIQSDLDIDGFMFKYASLATIPGTLSKKTIPFDTLTYQVTFVASYDANITPTWTLSHVAVNSSGKLLDAQRTKTSNLIITFAKTDSTDTATTKAALDAEGQQAHFAAVIGQAVAQAIQSVSH